MTVSETTVGELRSAFMYDPKCSTTFPWSTINAPAAFAWCTINARGVFASCANQFVHKVDFSDIEWNAVHTLWETLSEYFPIQIPMISHTYTIEYIVGIKCCKQMAVLEIFAGLFLSGSGIIYKIPWDVHLHVHVLVFTYPLKAMQYRIC